MRGLRRDHRLRLFASVVVLATAIWSFASLHDLASTLGFVKLALLFPLCVDAVAALGMDVWMSRSPAWRLGRRLALGAIAVSILGNVADWVLNLADWRSAVLSAIPPGMLAATLLVLHRHYAPVPVRSGATPIPVPEPAPEPEPAPPATPTPRPQPVPAPRTVAPKSVPRRSQDPVPWSVPDPVPTDDQGLVALLVQYHARHGTLPPRRAAMAVLRVGSNRVTGLLRAAREQTEAAA